MRQLGGVLEFHSPNMLLCKTNRGGCGSLGVLTLQVQNNDPEEPLELWDRYPRRSWLLQRSWQRLGAVVAAPGGTNAWVLVGGGVPLPIASQAAQPGGLLLLFMQTSSQTYRKATRMAQKNTCGSSTQIHPALTLPLLPHHLHTFCARISTYPFSV